MLLSSTSITSIHEVLKTRKFSNIYKEGMGRGCFTFIREHHRDSPNAIIDFIGRIKSLKYRASSMQIRIWKQDPTYLI